MPNFILLDRVRPEVARLVAAMLKAREAVETLVFAKPIF